LQKPPEKEIVPVHEELTKAVIQKAKGEDDEYKTSSEEQTYYR
jgi:hypothetical protein